MDLGLQDHVIVVTGGASGIGAAVTRLCLAEGARVIVLSRISAGVADFIKERVDAKEACELIEIELVNVEECKKAIEGIAHRYGAIHALVNNAGVNDGVGLESGHPERFLASLNTNLLPAYTLAHYALPYLKKTSGTIVNVASKVALTGQGNTSGYAAAKGGLLALTREWAVELSPYGIRVNAVVPAEVMTPAYQLWLDSRHDAAATLDRISQQIPLGRRMTKPQEIAATIVFLLSPIQSAHTTAQQVVVDGGYMHLDRAITSN